MRCAYLIVGFCLGLAVGWLSSQVLMRRLLAARLSDLRKALSDDAGRS